MNKSKIRDWVNSKEGKKTIKAALEESKRMAEEFRKDKTIDWRDLNRPMTI